MEGVPRGASALSRVILWGLSSNNLSPRCTWWPGCLEARSQALWPLRCPESACLWGLGKEEGNRAGLGLGQQGGLGQPLTSWERPQGPPFEKLSDILYDGLFCSFSGEHLSPPSITSPRETRRKPAADFCLAGAWGLCGLW